eukprot:scaffold46554_cov55-Attheya_sp.AAC.2
MRGAGTQDPRKQRCVALTSAILKRAFTYLHTWEYVFAICQKEDLSHTFVIQTKHAMIAHDTGFSTIYIPGMSHEMGESQAWTFNALGLVLLSMMHVRMKLAEWQHDWENSHVHCQTKMGGYTSCSVLSTGAPYCQRYMSAHFSFCHSGANKDKTDVII